MAKKTDMDKKYILDLLALLLDSAYIANKRFDDLLGDPGISGKRVRLSLDGYFEEYKLIVEYRDRFDCESFPIIDSKMTVSGVPRSIQREIYDQRKEVWAKKNGFQFLIIQYTEFDLKKNGCLDRNLEKDLGVLAQRLEQIDILHRFL